MDKQIESYMQIYRVELGFISDIAASSVNEPIKSVGGNKIIFHFEQNFMLSALTK